MALPTLSVPTFTVTIPSSTMGEPKDVVTVELRPFLVSEQKLLLMAQQSKDTQTKTNAIKQVITNCSLGKIDVNSLATFDLEYLFLQLRAKSVGETANPVIECPNCKSKLKLNINLMDIKVQSEGKVQFKFPLSNGIGITLKFPKINLVEQADKFKSDVEFMNFVFTECTDCIWDGESVYYLKDFTQKEVTQFIDSLTSEQAKIFQTFFESMPKINHEVSYTCGHRIPQEDGSAKVCGCTGKVVLRSLDDIFRDSVVP